MSKKTNHYFRLFFLIALILFGWDHTPWLNPSPPSSIGAASIPDKKISVNIGQVKITTCNPVTITDLEYSTNFYFVVRNNSANTLTLELTSLQKIIDSLPNWILHFFYFQPESLKIAPGKEKTFEFILTNESTGTKTLPFTFKVKETGKQKTIRLKIRSVKSPAFWDLPLTAEVKGKVTSSDGQPISNAMVKICIYNGRQEFNEQTDSQGNFSHFVPSVEDIRQIFGPRTLPYRSLDYFVVVEADGYELGYKDDITPKNEEPVTCNFTLDPVVKPTYEMVGELKTSGVHGYFWLLPNKNFTRLAAVQARHPPALQKPGHILMADNSGTELWRLTTGDESWGFSVAQNRLAAGCHDGMVYVTDLAGNILLQFDSGGMNREVELSPWANKLFTGPYMGEDAALLNVDTGKVLWTYMGDQQWLRNSRFSPNSQRIIAGFSGGSLVMLSNKGDVLWKKYIGEFPLLLEIDKQYNVYAAGKNRELFSFDAKGNLRWRCRIGNHVISAGSNNISKKGDLIVFGTVGGFLYAFDKTGKILWRRKLTTDAVLLGHNALDVTPNGKWIVAGSAGNDRSVSLYNRKGTLLWSQKFSDWRDPSKYDHNQTGPITVAISDDASRIAAGFGDSIIRFFKRK